MTTNLFTSVEIPTLSEENVKQWLDSVADLADGLGVSAHLMADTPDVGPEIQTRVAALKIRMKAAMSADFFDNNLSDIPRHERTPFKVIQKVKEVLLSFTDEDRDDLREQALALRAESSADLDRFIEEHKRIRQRMIRAQMDNISDEKTTINLVIRSLRNNPRSRQVARLVYTA